MWITQAISFEFFFFFSFLKIYLILQGLWIFSRFENPLCLRISSFKTNSSVVQVTRLLMDTSVLQFYPTLFVLATDILDTLGDMVWERIKWKAEFAEDGTRLYSLQGLVHRICLSNSVAFPFIHLLME